MGKHRIPAYQPIEDAPDFKSFDTLAEAQKAQTDWERSMHKRTLLLCTSFLSRSTVCETYFAVGDAVYEQTHYYIGPSGCTDGDYWLPGEGAVLCPVCGNRNRDYDSPHVKRLKPYFKEVINTY